MSKVICSSAIEGAIEWVARAEKALSDAIAQKGGDHRVAFPNTAYYLPVIYSFTGRKVETLADMRAILKEVKADLPARPSDEVWLPYLGAALDAGVIALFSCEIIEACRYLVGPDPQEGIWLGAADDVIMRERGIEFVDGTAPGFAAITGAAPDNATAVTIARELQEKNLYVFMGGSSNGRQFAEQLDEEGVQLGWETRLVPFGREVSSLIYALGFANRAALSFGGVKPGDFASNLNYNRNRIFAFVLAFGEVTPDKYAVAAGAINYGFPVIADTDIPQILPTGICTYEHVVSRIPPEHMVEKALEVRGCKIKITKVPIPVPYGAAFEGERIRKADVHAEFGGNMTTAFEFVTSVAIDEITDGAIDIVGPDIDQVAEGTVLPLAIWVEVAGRKMQTDFEPILERQIHHMINGAEGIWHMGQRDIVWTRVSKDGFAKGLRLRHYGEIIHSKFLSDYPAIVDKVKVTLITDPGEVERRIAIARTVYRERNKRLASMTDESVDTFYSCLLCQSFAPNHVCIITPERLGLCGAYNWLDGKAAYEIDETGPNQPVKKGECLDPVKGVWREINNYVFTNSHKNIKEFCAYSLMDRPMTSCGCFECIVAYLPECNGVMIVNREFAGETPVGMTFSTLAGNVGGGQQTPGFMGVGKAFLTSRKFLFAEGGFRRIVWMPKELKEMLGADLKAQFEAIGEPGLLEIIADETIAIEAEAVRAYCEKVNHPALRLEDMARFAERARPDAAPDRETEKPAQPLRSSEADATHTLPDAVSELTQDSLEALKQSITNDILHRIRSSLSGEIAQQVSAALSGNDEVLSAPSGVGKEPAITAPSASQRLSGVLSVPINRTVNETSIWKVTLGATREQGGTRKKTITVGGASCMPFHRWQGTMPCQPVVAMEVFDLAGEKYPAILREFFGNSLNNPAEMAKVCVEKYGAEMISVRLEGTHPEKGDRSAGQAVDTVKAVLEAVEVPLIVTGHGHFDKTNEVLKAVAQACSGERLLLNWVEQDNYRTLAGAAMAYNHCLVAQSPIDVNIGKQLNILLTAMGVNTGQIVMDPMTGALGYGIEYTYSVMERIRLSALSGDAMLAGPMIVSPGQECVKIKEFRAPQSDFPEWGDLGERAALWETATALALVYAGADILVMYHPEAVKAIQQAVRRLMEKE
jgi:acetyl-CoA synthase